MKNDEAGKAIDLFHRIENPNDVILNQMLNACALLRTDEALTLVKKTALDAKPSFYSNRFLMTSLLDALIKCGDVKSAESLFSEMKKKTVEMYGAMMNGDSTFYLSSRWHMIQAPPRICEEPWAEQSNRSVPWDRESQWSDTDARAQRLCSTAERWSYYSGQEDLLQPVRS